MKKVNAGAAIHFRSDWSNMIHGIYLRSKPKNKWHLISLTLSPEAANFELDACKKQAIKEGNEQAEVAIQIFESDFWIPEYISEIKKQNPQFN